MKYLIVRGAIRFRGSGNGDSEFEPTDSTSAKQLTELIEVIGVITCRRSLLMLKQAIGRFDDRRRNWDIAVESLQ